eukprot:COSAG02_NODE_20177_length_845_cov_0.969169_2_plen_112_part_00
MACRKAHMGVLGTMAGHLHRSTERKAAVRVARTAQMSMPVSEKPQRGGIALLHNCFEPASSFSWHNTRRIDACSHLGSPAALEPSRLSVMDATLFAFGAQSCVSGLTVALL